MYKEIDRHVHTFGLFRPFQGGLTLPSRELYSEDPNKTLRALHRFLSEIVGMAGGDPEEHGQEIQDIIDFEAELAKLTVRDDQVNVKKTVKSGEICI